MLSLVPTDTAYAQEGPSIDIEFSPHYMVRDNEELNFTLTFSGLTGHSDLTYEVNVATFGEPDVPECEGTGTGEGMTLGFFFRRHSDRDRNDPGCLPSTSYVCSGREII